MCENCCNFLNLRLLNNVLIKISTRNVEFVIYVEIYFTYLYIFNLHGYKNLNTEEKNNLGAE